MTKSEYEKLVDKLKEWNALYEKGSPIVDDIVFDYNYDLVKEYELENNIKNKDSITNIIGTVDKSKKIKHKQRMYSLKKTYNKTDVVEMSKKDMLVIMPKYDGVAIKLIYLNGELTDILTRGNGKYGISLRHLKSKQPFKKFKKCSDDITEVVGELVISIPNFKRVHKITKREFINNRSLVSSVITNKKNMDLANYLKFRPFGIVTTKEFSVYSNELDYLKSVFNVKIPYKKTNVLGCSELDLFPLITTLTAETSSYPKEVLE